MSEDVPTCPHDHLMTPENTGLQGRCRECKRVQSRQARRAAGAKERAFDPEWFPCGHPRNPENKGSQGKCRECARVKAKAYHHAKVAEQGRELRVMDPEWFPCGHPRIAGNLTPRGECRVCHIDRAMKSYRENPGPRRRDGDAWRKRERAYKECLREERADPMTTDYLRIIRADPCSYCGGTGGTRDHIVTISANGPNHWENYTGACASCNVAKSDKTLLSYLLDRLILQQVRNGRVA